MHEHPLIASASDGFPFFRGRRELFFWAICYLLVAAGVQFLIVSVPIDADTAFHAAVGQLIRQHGILHAFPWTPFSWLADHYADKELLFHLLFVPFIGLGWITASKIVGMLLGALLLFAIFLVLKAEGVRFAGVWGLLPLVTSDVFLYRFALVRPHLLSITLAIVLLWTALRGRYLLLTVVSVLYPWSYVAFWQLPLIVLGIVESARFLSGGRVRWKPAAVSVGGILIGLFVHPNALNLLAFNWIQMTDVLLKNAWLSKPGIELGLEFQPFAPLQWATWLLAAVVMMLVGLAAGWRTRKQDPGLLAVALAALVFGILTARTARFAEYFIPFSALAMALASRSIRWRGLVAVVFALSLLYTAKPLYETTQGLHAKEEIVPRQLATWLQQRIPVGSQVFTTEWGHTGTLMLALPDRKFIVALDPTLFEVKDPELYRIWYTLPRHPHAGDAEIIRKRFGARFVIGLFDDRFMDFYFQLSSEPGVRALLLSDEHWAVFDLGGVTNEHSVPETGRH
jgi:hypothetical protein